MYENDVQVQAMVAMERYVEAHNSSLCCTEKKNWTSTFPPNNQQTYSTVNELATDFVGFLNDLGGSRILIIEFKRKVPDHLEVADVKQDQLDFLQSMQTSGIEAYLCFNLKDILHAQSTLPGENRAKEVLSNIASIPPYQFRTAKTEHNQAYFLPTSAPNSLLSTFQRFLNPTNTKETKAEELVASFIVNNLKSAIEFSNLHLIAIKNTSMLHLGKDSMKHLIEETENLISSELSNINPVLNQLREERSVNYKKLYSNNIDKNEKNQIKEKIHAINCELKIIGEQVTEIFKNLINTSPTTHKQKNTINATPK